MSPSLIKTKFWKTSIFDCDFTLRSFFIFPANLFLPISILTFLYIFYFDFVSFFYLDIYFPFLYGLLFPFSIRTFISLFHLNFYLPFLHWLLYPFTIFHFYSICFYHILFISFLFYWFLFLYFWLRSNFRFLILTLNNFLKNRPFCFIYLDPSRVLVTW